MPPVIVPERQNLLVAAATSEGRLLIYRSLIFLSLPKARATRSSVYLPPEHRRERNCSLVCWFSEMKTFFR